MVAIVTRFAPSPTGYLHLGHAYSALLAWRVARRRGGRFLLRIEDIDTSRCRAEFATAIPADLAWLGLDWDGVIRRQSEHLDDYAAALARLRAMAMVYPCFCSRQDIAAAASAPQAAAMIYPGTCRSLPAALAAERLEAGRPYALRLDAAKAMRAAGPLFFDERSLGRVAVRPDLLGDVVLARRDAPASYHLCVTLDDHLQGVTLVTRGEDLLPSTHVHRLLQAVLGLEAPAYDHHRLLTDDSGRRLAKRDRALSLRRMREAGLLPGEIRALAGFGPSSAAADEL